MTSIPAKASDVTVATTNPANALYDAAVNYMVSDQTKATAWEGMVAFVQARVSEGYDANKIAAVIEAVEAQIKKDFSISIMPSTWRSAKSVVLKAVLREQPLLQEDGKPVAKTVMEKKNKEANPSAGYNFSKIRDQLEAICVGMPALTDTEQDTLAQVILSKAPVSFIHLLK